MNEQESRLEREMDFSAHADPMERALRKAIRSTEGENESIRDMQIKHPTINPEQQVRRAARLEAELEVLQTSLAIRVVVLSTKGS
jgi:hypothetical protein